MTKQSMINRYNAATCGSLAEAYRTGGSVYKRRAEDAIRREMEYLHGWGFRITSANTFEFSCAYLYKKDGKTVLVYHTACNCWEVDYVA